VIAVDTEEKGRWLGKCVRNIQTKADHIPEINREKALELLDKSDDTWCQCQCQYCGNMVDFEKGLWDLPEFKYKYDINKRYFFLVERCYFCHDRTVGFEEKYAF